jgi:hypothetical protein
VALGWTARNVYVRLPDRRVPVHRGVARRCRRETLAESTGSGTEDVRDGANHDPGEQEQPADHLKP